MKYIAVIVSVVVCVAAICLRFWLTKRHFDRLDEKMHQRVAGEHADEYYAPKEKHNLASILIGTVLIVLVICLLALFMTFE